MEEERKNTVWIVLIVLLTLAIVGVLVAAVAMQKPKDTVPAALDTPRPTEKVVYVEKESIVEVVKETSVETIQEGLRDMGTLITAEYYFTEVVNHSSYKTMKFLWMEDAKVPLSESYYIVSYDGVATAGIDFGQIEVSKDETLKTILVKLPAAEIRNIDIDPNSFKLYDEQESIFNPISVSDYNDSLIQMEETARSNALAHGLLKRADDNAKTLVLNFVSKLVDQDAYKVVCEKK